MDKSQVWDKYIAMEVVKFFKKNRSAERERERERERELFGGFIIRGENVRMSSLNVHIQFLEVVIFIQVVAFYQTHRNWTLFFFPLSKAVMLIFYNMRKC